jgi:four helix bundle protein
MSDGFEELLVWQRAQLLAVTVCRELEDCKNYGFRDQIMRSAVSVPSNIAEGAERLSPKEFIQFLSYAKGSCGELRCQLMIAQSLGYIAPEKTNGLIDETREISRMLWGLIGSLKKDT